MAFFDESYYLQAKLKQLAAVNETDANGKPYTEATLRSAIEQNGLTPETHYQMYGNEENLNPNPYFNEAEYLEAKVAQLNSVGDKTPDGKAYTVDALVKVLQGHGLSAAEHYEMYGSKETTADGHLINPSNAFDANAYVAAKLVELQASEPAAWAGKTVADVFDAFVAAGISPVTHYDNYGADEAAAAKTPLVQTVPAGQRVANDPVRETLNEVVPTNYNPPSAAPSAAVATPVAKPADLGQKVPVAVSPTPIIPEHPAPVPGDSAYVAPPTNIKDTVANPVIPPSSTDAAKASGNWMVVNPDKGTGTIIGQDGAIKGEVKVEITPGTGGSTVVIPPAEDKPVADMPPVTELPPSVTVKPDNPGNVSPDLKPDPKPEPKPDPEPTPEPEPKPDPEPTPDPVNTALTATADANGKLVVEGAAKGVLTISLNAESKATFDESGVDGTEATATTVAVKSINVSQVTAATGITYAMSSDKLTDSTPAFALEGDEPKVSTAVGAAEIAETLALSGTKTINFAQHKWFTGNVDGTTPSSATAVDAFKAASTVLIDSGRIEAVSLTNTTVTANQTFANIVAFGVDQIGTVPGTTAAAGGTKLVQTITGSSANDEIVLHQTGTTPDSNDGSGAAYEAANDMKGVVINGGGGDKDTVKFVQGGEGETNNQFKAAIFTISAEAKAGGKFLTDIAYNGVERLALDHGKPYGAVYFDVDASSFNARAASGNLPASQGISGFELQTSGNVRGLDATDTVYLNGVPGSNDYIDVGLGAATSGGAVNVVAENTGTAVQHFFINPSGRGAYPGSTGDPTSLATNYKFGELKLSGNDDTAVTFNNATDSEGGSGSTNAVTVSAGDYKGDLTVILKKDGYGTAEADYKDITLGSGNDEVYGDGATDANYHSGSGSEATVKGITITGGKGADIMRGTVGNDTIYGNAAGSAGYADADGTGTNPLADRYTSGGMVGNWNTAFNTAMLDADGSSADGTFVNVFNGWLGNDKMYATSAKDSFEYHTHVSNSGNGNITQGYATSTFKALGEDTIVGFELGKDMLFVNMIELASGNGSGGHGITAVSDSQTSSFADILIEANLAASDTTVANDDGKVSYTIASLSASAVTALGVSGDSSTTNDYKVVFTFGNGESADTLTINLVDLVGVATSATFTDASGLFLA